MSEVLWKDLAKAIDDKTKISDEIDAKIVAHNEDPSAHGQANEAITVHREGEILDHLDGSVTNDKLAVDSVTANKIKAGTITATEIASNAITSDKILADAVTASKINVVGLDGATGRIVVADETDANAVTEGINSHASTLITAGKIVISGATNLDDWRKSTDLTKIDGGKISTNTVTAAQISVTNLAAINADLGTVTAGTITGLTIQSSADANTGVKITTGGLYIYGMSLYFKTTSGADAGTISGEVGGIVKIDAQLEVANGILSNSEGIDCTGAESFFGQIEIESVTSHLIPIYDDQKDLGSSTVEWRNLFLDGTAQVDALRIDQTPTAESNTATHYAIVNFNGTNYKVLLKSI